MEWFWQLCRAVPEGSVSKRRRPAVVHELGAAPGAFQLFATGRHLSSATPACQSCGRLAAQPAMLVLSAARCLQVQEQHGAANNQRGSGNHGMWVRFGMLAMRGVSLSPPWQRRSLHAWPDACWMDVYGSYCLIMSVSGPYSCPRHVLHLLRAAPAGSPSTLYSRTVPCVSDRNPPDCSPAQTWLPSCSHPTKHGWVLPVGFESCGQPYLQAPVHANMYSFLNHEGTPAQPRAHLPAGDG